MTTRNNVKLLTVVPLHCIERTPVLISTFSGGYTGDWKFKLPTAFRDALDIKLTNRMIEKKRYSILTQGDAFSFKTGDTIYDSPLAYTLPWEDAIKIIKFAIQVKEASPGGVYQSELITVHDADEPATISINRIVDGNIIFDLLKKSDTSLVHFRTFKTTQIEFVRFLQQGIMLTSDSIEVHLSDLMNEAFPNLREFSQVHGRKIK